MISKQARVVEEIGLRKEAVDRVETVRDTVRETKVEVEQSPDPVATPAWADRRVWGGYNRNGQGRRERNRRQLRDPSRG